MTVSWTEFFTNDGLAEAATAITREHVLDLGLPASGTPENVAQVMRAAYDGAIVVVSGNPHSKEIAASIDAACVGKPSDDGAIENAVRFAIRASSAPHAPR